MRFRQLFLLCVTATGLLFGPSANVFAASSFGPEISAEDFNQHVHALSESAGSKQRQAYLQQQFLRLGLSLDALNCPTVGNGLRASLSSQNNNSPDTAYFADTNDVYQIASVLELAERFMTFPPRPTHPVHFIFSGLKPEELKTCSPLLESTLILQAKGMEKLGPASLVRDLNALHRQGK